MIRFFIFILSIALPLLALLHTTSLCAHTQLLFQLMWLRRTKFIYSYFLSVCLCFNRIRTTHSSRVTRSLLLLLLVLFCCFHSAFSNNLPTSIAIDVRTETVYGGKFMCRAIKYKTDTDTQNEITCGDCVCIWILAVNYLHGVLYVCAFCVLHLKSVL